MMQLGILAVQGNLAIRSTIILVATLSAVFWLLFAAAQYPWIVPADHNTSTRIELERASEAGLWLFGLSLVTVCLAAGYFGKKRAMYVIAVAILAVWLGTCPLLYPSFDVLQFPFRLFAHVLSVGLVLGGVLVVPKTRQIKRSAVD